MSSGTIVYELVRMQDDQEAHVFTVALHRFTFNKSDCWSGRMKEELDNLGILHRIVKSMKAIARTRIRHKLCAPYITLSFECFYCN